MNKNLFEKKVLLFANPGYGEFFLKKLLNLKNVKVVGVFKRSDSSIFNLLNIFKINLFHRKNKSIKKFFNYNKIKNLIIKLNPFKNKIHKSTIIENICIENNIPIYDPALYFSSKLRKYFLEMNIDVILVTSYSYLIPEHIIKLAKFYGINFHPSLLPQYRGSNSEFCAIFNGEKKSGITFHILNKQFDTGDIILQKEFYIEDGETTSSYKKKAAELGCFMLEDLFKLIDNKKDFEKKLKKQNKSLISYCSLPNEYDHLGKNLTVKEVINRVNAFNGSGKNPYVIYKKKKIFILSLSKFKGLPFKFLDGEIFFNKIIYKSKIYEGNNLDWLRG